MADRHKWIVCGVLFTALAGYWFPWGILSRPEVSSTVVFDSEWQEPETRVASNGVQYQVYPGGGITFRGGKRPAGLPPADITLTAQQYRELSDMSPKERLKILKRMVADVGPLPYDASKYGPKPYDASKYGPKPYDASKYGPGPYDVNGGPIDD